MIFLDHVSSFLFTVNHHFVLLHLFTCCRVSVTTTQCWPLQRPAYKEPVVAGAPENRSTGVIFVQTLVHCSARASRSLHEHLDRLRTHSIAKELRVTVADTLGIKTETGWIAQGEKIRGQKYRNGQRSVSVHEQQSS